MKSKFCILLISIILIGSIILTGCFNQNEENSGSVEDAECNSDENTQEEKDYEETDGDVANFLSYNYKEGSMYIAGLKAFQEFGKSNEGSVKIDKEENYLTFVITKSTGTVNGAVDGPSVYFKMDLTTKDIIDKKLEPAPNYEELGIAEFAENSEEVIKVTDERMVEIGEYFINIINKIE